MRQHCIGTEPRASDDCSCPSHSHTAAPPSHPASCSVPPLLFALPAALLAWLHAPCWQPHADAHDCWKIVLAEALSKLAEGQVPLAATLGPLAAAGRDLAQKAGRRGGTAFSARIFSPSATAWSKLTLPAPALASSSSSLGRRPAARRHGWTPPTGPGKLYAGSAVPAGPRSDGKRPRQRSSELERPRSTPHARAPPAGARWVGAQRLPHRLQHLSGAQPLCAHAAGESPSATVGKGARNPVKPPPRPQGLPGGPRARRRSPPPPLDRPLPARTRTILTALPSLALPPSRAQIEYGGQCHISNRPYTVFRWRPGNDARYKKTIVCQEVAKAKNVCQVGATRVPTWGTGAVCSTRNSQQTHGTARAAHKAAATPCWVGRLWVGWGWWWWWGGGGLID